MPCTSSCRCVCDDPPLLVTLVRLEITALRNLRQVSIEPGPAVNVFHGSNGSGKTSLLEAVHLLGLGRSFRTVRARRLVQDEQPSCTVFGHTAAGHSLGIQKPIAGDTLVRINGGPAPGLAALAQHLPIQLFDPLSFDIMSGASQPRRQLLDWGVFHVEQKFYGAWSRAQRALQQRNSLLKAAKISPMELQVWEQELTEAALPLHTAREQFMAEWRPWLDAALLRLLPDIALDVDYQPGWDLTLSLAEALQASRGKDMERGFTQLGPHRADLKIRVNGVAVDERLSRGQLKLVVCALKLSMVQRLMQSGIKPILLMDDLPSELDAQARAKVCQWIGEMGVQSLLTCIDPAQLEGMWGDIPIRMFHVEQGCVSPTVG